MSKVRSEGIFFLFFMSSEIGPQITIPVNSQNPLFKNGVQDNNLTEKDCSELSGLKNKY